MKNKLEQLLAHLQSGLIERSVASRLSLLAALSGEHLLLLGPPGTAKSELARKLHQLFSGARYFERLLTRFSVPEELFGPLSIKALEEDRYHRLTENYLPSASVAFIDEIFKANSAILNALLTLLNEREFDNGGARVKTPLLCVIAASNELPEEEGLDALYDRFLIRYQVSPVSDNGFDDLLKLSLQAEVEPQTQATQLTLEDIESIQLAAAQIPLDEHARRLIHGLREYLARQDIYISDRRWRKAIKILQLSALTNQQTAISQWDCVLLSHVMWQLPEQQEGLNQWFIEALNLDIEATIRRLQKLLQTWEEQLAEDSSRQIQKTNAQGEYLYKTPEGKITTRHEQVSLAERDGDLLYLAPPGQQERTNQGKGYTLDELEKLFFDKHFKQTHIDGRWVDVQNYINNTQNRLVERIEFEPLVEASCFSESYIENQRQELEKLLADMDQILHDYNQRLRTLKEVSHSHLWLKDGLLKHACQRIGENIPQLVDFQQRLQVLLGLNAGLAKPAVPVC